MECSIALRGSVHTGECDIAGDTLTGLPLSIRENSAPSGAPAVRAHDATRADGLLAGGRRQSDAGNAPVLPQELGRAGRFQQIDTGDTGGAPDQEVIEGHAAHRQAVVDLARLL